jgi:hypothetical protein
MRREKFGDSDSFREIGQIGRYVCDKMLIHDCALRAVARAVCLTVLRGALGLVPSVIARLPGGILPGLGRRRERHSDASVSIEYPQKAHLSCFCSS